MKNWADSAAQAMAKALATMEGKVQSAERGEAFAAPPMTARSFMSDLPPEPRRALQRLHRVYGKAVDMPPSGFSTVT